MGWAFTEHIWWLVLVPIGILFAVLIFIRAEKVTKTLFSSEQYALGDPIPKMILRIVGLMCLGVALLGPYWGRTEQKVKVMSREIYFVLDVSASMNAEDIKPSRLEKVKKELKRIVYDLKGDKMGLIVFSGNAYLQCPLTDDYNALNLFIDLVSTDQFANTSTDFRAGLSLALQRFSVSENEVENITRSVVLISDGENFGDAYQSVKDRLKEKRVKVFPVGVGTPEGAPVPNIVYGKVRGYKQGPDGQPAISKIQEETLKNFAEEFDTEYLLIDNQIDNLIPVAEQIRLQSASVVNTKTEMVNNNHFQIILLIGLICLAASLFLMPIKKESTENLFQKYQQP